MVNGTYNNSLAFEYNAEFAILMARFADDAKLGKQAIAAMRDVRKCSSSATKLAR